MFSSNTCVSQRTGLCRTSLKPVAALNRNSSSKPHKHSNVAPAVKDGKLPLQQQLDRAEQARLEQTDAYAELVAQSTSFQKTNRPQKVL